MLSLKIKYKIPGKAIGYSLDGRLFVGRNYKLYGLDSQNNVTCIAKAPCPVKRRLIEKSRLLCRLFRHEIRGAIDLDNGTKVVATRQGLFYGQRGEMILTAAKMSALTPEIKQPMMITADSQNRIIWGEYWGNPDLRPVRLFVSHDRGRSYEPFFTFKPGEVKHVHNIVEDAYEDCFWVLAGDHARQSGIGRLSKDLKTFDWLVKGEQKYRAVCVFPFVDHLIYATDSEKEPNYICSLDKKTSRLEKICPLPGSCIYAARFGKWYIISTSAEYFDFDTVGNTMATLWASRDCLNWQRVFAARKDIWNKKYFQFGSLILPRGQWDSDLIVFSGQAVKQYDNITCISEIMEN